MNLPKIFSEQQLDKILHAPRIRTWAGIRARAMLETLAQTGLRVSELCDMRIRDLDRGHPAMIFVSQGKGGKDRWVPAAGAELWIDKWLARRGEYGPEGYVFVSKRGKRVDRSVVYRLVQRLGLQSGIPEDLCHPHTFRHTYATNLLDMGMDVREVQVLLGHSRLTTTTIYLAVCPRRMARKLDRLRVGGIQPRRDYAHPAAAGQIAV
jgi:integrase/recombinase XerD